MKRGQPRSENGRFSSNSEVNKLQQAKSEFADLMILIWKILKISPILLVLYLLWTYLDVPGYIFDLVVQGACGKGHHCCPNNSGNKKTEY